MAKNRQWIYFLGLTLLLIGLSVADICHGLAWQDIFCTSQDGATVGRQIFMNLRLPKLITAILAGASLSIAGVMMQTLFRNPLAGPYILGISSGAGLGVALVTMLGGLGVGFLLSRYAMVVAAIVGAASIMALMLLVAHRVRNNVTLLIVGMMFGAVAGALVNLIQNFANPDALKLFIVWTFGSVSSVGWSELTVLLPLVALSALLLIFLVKPLNGLLMGEDYARGVGVNVERVRKGIIGVTCLLAGGITAFCGPVAFVGVAVPHLSRGLFGTSNHRVILPSAALIGANLLVLCDFISSCFAYPLPISTLSSLFAAPIIIYVILKQV